MSRLRRVLAALMMVLCWTTFSWASDDPNNSRGFSADNLYQFGELDTVDLFNGNLTLVLPIGQSYPINAGFDYRLNLVYNSNAWDFGQRLGQVPSDGPRPVYTVARYGYHCNAGLGWRLSLGELRAPETARNATNMIVYVGADGASHTFWPSLHDDEPEVSSVRYTRDGSYLRLKAVGATDVLDATAVTLEFPGGMRHHFTRGNTSQPFKLAWMKDRFGNTLTVSMTDTRWTLSDGHRSHTVHFVLKSIDGQAAIPIVDRVVLATFGNTTATYQFQYNDNFTTERHEKDTDPETSVSVEVPVLTSVSLPDGSSWDMTSYYTTATEGAGLLGRVRLPTGGQLEYQYEMYDYFTRNQGPPGSRISVDANYGVRRKRMLNLAGNCFAVGEVGCEWTYTPAIETSKHRTTTVTTPSGDKIVHHFNQTPFLDPDGSWEGWEYGLPMHPTTQSGGRYLSQEIFEGNTKVREVWVEYERDVIPPSPGVSDPNPAKWYDTNRRVKSRQTVYKDDGGRFRREEFSGFDGLGHYRQQVQSSTFPGGLTRTLRTEYNSGRGSYTVDLGANLASGGFQVWPAGSEWLIETFPQKSQAEGSDTAKQQFCFDGATGVVKRQRTLKGNSPGSSDILRVYTRNGVGNVTRESIHGGDTGNLGTGVICNTSLGTEQYRRDFQYFRGTLSEAKWVNGSGGTVLFTHRSSNDRNTGFPATVTASNELVTTLDYDTSGRLTSEVPQSGHGARTTYTYSPANSSFAEVLIRRFSNNGSILLTRNEIEFDDFGRPWRDRQREPSGATSTVVTTTNAMGWRASVTERQFGFPAAKTTFKNFDPFGRARRIVPPDGSGHQIFVTHAGDRIVTRTQSVCAASDGCLPDGSGPQDGDLTLSSATLTTSQSYEVLGEINVGPSYTIAASGDLSLTATDGVTLKTGFSVASGGRLSVGVDVNLGQGFNGETEVQHVSRYDKHGRLYQVSEPSGPNGATVTTTYRYDVGNRLRQANTSSAGVTQSRLFNYDDRGFLDSERHPEKGSSGNGYVTYSLYDPLGNPGRKVDGPFDLRYDYDRAGRLTNIDEQASGGLRPVKEFEYATTNSGTDLRMGQLWKATRHNYADVGGTAFTVEVEETYEYAGRAGAVSQRDTQLYVNGGAQEGFTQGFSWHDLGNLNYLDYPECTHSWCSTPSPRRVRYLYKPNHRGFLNSVRQVSNPGGTLVKEYVTGHDYHANGMPQTVTHGNGTSDRAALDSDMARPDRLWTQGANSNWDSGSYVYDGSGNISAIGNQRFSYDGVSRLTRAQIGTAQTNGGSNLTRNYAYDAFGNLEQIGALTPPVDSATNRLTGTAYDAAGNVTNYNGTLFEYDAVGMVTQRTVGADSWYFFYTADDERLWTFWPGNPSRWTLRDLDGQVLRDYRSESVSGTPVWTPDRDYIRANGKLIAAELASGATHYYHSDHLGTPRLITDQNGNKTAYHAYYPYGEEATFWNQDSERMKFTGHERDFYDDAGPGDDLDYQHARYYSFRIGRYFSPDPVLQAERSARKPQLWNRFTYGLANPLSYVDPSGRIVNLAAIEDDEERHELIEQISEKTGLSLSYSEETGNLEIIGFEKNSSGEIAGSGLARQAVVSAVSSSETTYVQSLNGSDAVTMGKRIGPLIRLDFNDLGRIDTGKNDSRTFDASMVFLHELKHVQGLKDPVALSGKVSWAKGPTVEFMNKVRSELGLPARGQYRTSKTPARNGLYKIPFSDGPVLVPGKIK